MDDRQLALEMAAWMEAHLEEDPDHAGMARASGYSENRLRQKFFAVTGETPAAWIRKRRLTRAAADIATGSSLCETALRWGYSSQDNFSTAFKALCGLSPGEFRALDRRYRECLSCFREPLTMGQLEKLGQPSNAATLMNCMKGASDYFDLGWTDQELYGYGTMGFLVNIHRELCPSGPYAWKKDRFWLRMRDMGIRMAGQIFILKDAPAEEFRKAEDRLKTWLDQGKLVMLEWLEYQLVLGYGETGLEFLKSWNDCDAKTELAALGFGGFREAMEPTGWVSFFLLEKEDLRPSREELLAQSLATVTRMGSLPGEWTFPSEIQGAYGVADGAWELWMAGVDKGLGNTHGHWWNAMVWSECRRMAARFLEGVAGNAPEGSPARKLAALVASLDSCADLLQKAGNKEAPAAEQKAALAECRTLDRNVLDGLEAFLREVPGASRP